MSGRRFNEGKALDAVLRRIETRDGVMRGDDLRFPEKENHPAPVDLVCTVGTGLVAFEHTGIEPFPRQIEMEQHNRALFGPVTAQLDRTMPASDHVELHVPVDASLGLKRSQIAPIQKTLGEWVQKAVPTLPVATLGRYVTPVEKVSLPGVPFPVSLHRMQAIGPMRGRFSVVYLVSGDLERARIIRLQESCEKKFGKLAEWKRTSGARTVLVFEDADIQLTNEQLIADALTYAEQGRTDAPDEVFVVNSCIDTPWFVTCLRREGRTYYDDGERFWEVDPAGLRPLTDR